MFKINYAIMDTEDEIRALMPSGCYIYGLFEMVANKKGYGIYSEEEEIRKCPGIFENLLFWFEQLTTVVKEIKKHGYALLNEIESYNTWIEFIYKENYIELSIIRIEDFSGGGYLSFDHILPSEREYGEWKKEKISFEEFSNGVIKSAENFLHTIYSINPTLRKEFSLKTIEENLLYLKKENERGI
ncbi:hypothetical protein [Selenomonas noxia]|uniref:Uncharacterized protein n=1 Tax=Selenomonas noxia F0398 TaxID=702437 RepID=A0ABN0DNZ5_9FIRM|nr:hypothetical protein [Selenomonas noxia]EHG24306.1 hypothetical protein HMPREF9432_01460 [Selenomonas noxia F0398]